MWKELNFLIHICKYALLITDVKTAKMTGFELYREIKKIDYRTKVVIMTAFEIYHDEFVKMIPDIDVRCFINKTAARFCTQV